MTSIPKKVVLFDRHFDGPFYDLIQTAFSPNKPLKRIESYNGKVVLFERLVWHLESPAGIVFPKVAVQVELVGLLVMVVMVLMSSKIC
jgi:hypothetical protein